MQPARFPLRLRIPGWARDTPVPGDLYTVARNRAAGHGAPRRQRRARARRGWTRATATITRTSDARRHRDARPADASAPRAGASVGGGQSRARRNPARSNRLCGRMAGADDGHVRNVVLQDEATLAEGGVPPGTARRRAGPVTSARRRTLSAGGMADPTDVPLIAIFTRRGPTGGWRDDRVAGAHGGWRAAEAVSDAGPGATTR